MLTIYSGPILQRFDLDMNYGGLVLHFDQPVLANTLDVERIFLQSRRNIAYSQEIYNFTQWVFNNLTAQGNTTAVYFFMGSDDFARLVVHPTIAKSSNDAYLSLAYGAFNSSIGVPSVPINSSAALPVSRFVPDSTSPYVVQFVLDMDLGYLSIDFSEPIDPSSFTLHGLALQGKRNALYENAYVMLEPVDNCHSLDNSSDYQRRMTCELGVTNINNVKRVAKLCTVINNTYLSAWQPFVDDLSGASVSIEGFERIFGMRAVGFEADYTPPMLDSWDLNLNSGQIILHFSEVLYMPLFNYSGVIICNTATLSGSTALIRVQNPMVTSYESTENVVIQLNAEQFNWIKYHENLATGDGSDTYIVLEPYLAVDYADAQNMYAGIDASATNARRVSNLTLDILPPELEHFELNMSSQTMLLVFTEVVDITTLNFDEFVFQSSGEVLPDTEVVAFDSSMLVNTEDSRFILLDLTSLFAEIKSKSLLAQSLDTSFVAFTYRFVDDQNHNNVVEIPFSRARRATVFVSDVQSPSLVSWTIDMSSDRLVLTFSEPVDVLSLQLQHLILQSVAVSSMASSTVTLSLTSTIENRILSDIYIQLSFEDANSVKRSSSLCRDANSCFLYFGDDLGFDVPSYTPEGIVRNAIIPLSSGVPPVDFIHDTKPPVLLSYTIDLNLGRLHMLFSEPVSTRNIDATGIKFYAVNATASDLILSLSAQSFSQYTDTASEEVELVLTRQDYFLLKKTGIFSEAYPLWLSMDNTSFYDSAGVNLDGSSFTDSLADNRVKDGDILFISPSQYVVDNSGPTVIALESSKSTRMTNITIYFDDAVKISTFYKPYVMIASFEAIRVLPITTATLLSDASSISNSIALSLLPMQSQIAATSPLLIDQANNHVYLASKNAVVDAYGNSNIRMSSTAAVRTGAAALHFLLHMDDGVLILELVYPVLISLADVDATKFKFKNTALGLEYILSSFNSVDLRGNGHFVYLYLNSLDMGNLRSMQLVSVRSEITLELKTTGIFYPANVQMSKTATLSCAQLIADTSSPQLDYYYLNMGTGILGIQFVEPVVVKSIDLTKISLVDASSNAVHSFRLTNSALVATTAALATSYLIQINLTAGVTHPTDRDKLHISEYIGRTVSETNLVIDPGFVHDTAIPRNYLNAITSASAFPVATLISDRTPPTLQKYDLDLQNRKLTLTFSEAVNATTLKVNQLTLLASQNTPTINLYTLTKVSVVSPETYALEATTVVVVNLGDTDVDEIMLRYPFLCTTASDTRLAFPTGTIKDLAFSSNSIQQVFKIYALPVNTYVADRKSPVILHYDVSVDAREIIFYFDEMVNCYATDVSKISFQSTSFLGTLTERYTLSAMSSYLIGCESNNYITRSITVKIGREDLVRIQTFSKLLKSAAMTKLNLARGAFSDATGNQIAAIVDGHTMDVRNFIADITRPRLLGFTVNTDRVMRLRFSEPMKIYSLDVTKIRLHNARIPTISYQLTSKAATVGSVDRDMMTLKLDLATDYDYMVGITDIFKYQSSSFLSIESGAITDTSGNKIMDIQAQYGLNIGPSVVDWDLNLNTGELVLYFSEKVVDNFSVNGIIFQNNASTPTKQVEISATQQNVSELSNDFFDSMTVFVVELSSIDITALKLSGLLTPTGEDLYLHTPLGLTVSPVINSVVPRFLSTASLFAVPLGEYTFDSTGPVVSHVELDLNDGTLIIKFDEPIFGASLDVSKISLLSNVFGNQIALTHLSSAIDYNTSTLRLNITDNDLNEVKYSFALGTLDKVLFDVDFVTDLFGNKPEGDDDLGGLKFIVPIDSFTPDITPPRLLNCFVDSSRYVVTLQFDEIVDVASLTPSNINFYSADHRGPHVHNMTLSEHSIVVEDPLHITGNVTIDMSLFRQDAFDFQAQPLIGENASFTYISMSGLTDVSGVPHDSAMIMQCQVGIDTSSPSLESFDFIGNGGNIDITLYFSEAIDVNSFDCADFKLSSINSVVASEMVTLSTGDCTVISSANSREIEFSVVSSLFTVIGADRSSTWLYAPSPSSTADVFGNVVQPISIVNALRVGPRVINYMIDMEAGDMVLIFSKDIDLSASFNSSGIGLYSAVSGQSVFLADGTATLSGYFSGADSSEFVATVTLQPNNLNRIKYIDVVEAKTYLLLRSDVFVDSDGSTSPLVDDSEMLKPSRFIEDEISPTIFNITLDMSLNRLIFAFDEPIRLSTFVSQKLTLQSAPGSLSSTSVISYGITGGTVKQKLVGEIAMVYVTLSDTDSGNIKLLPDIAKDLSSTYISIGYTPMEDMAGNSLDTIFAVSARPFDGFIPDSSAPVLKSFSLNMNTGELKLTFSEPMDASSVNTSQITLQNRYSKGLEGIRDHALSSDSVVTSGNGFIITIQIGDKDMYNIKNTDNLCRKRISTYMSVPSSAASDLAGNNMVRIIDGEALSVSSFVADTTPPEVTEIRLDMSAETLTFYFSELVETASAQISAVTIQESIVAGDGYSFTFTSISNTLINPYARKFSLSLQFQLATEDVNGIKWRRPLGNTQDTSFFLVTSALCYDVFLNPVAPISGDAMGLSQYVADFDPPTLLRYTLNMNTLVIGLEYSESVLLSSITLDQGILQRTSTKRFGNYVNLSFSSATIGADIESNYLEITIDPWTSYKMKWNKIALSQDSSYFTWGSEFVADGFGNYIVPLWDGSVLNNHPLLPDAFVADSTAPTLVKWFLDRIGMMMYLIFSEPVDMKDCSGINIHAASVNVSFGSCSPTYDDYGTKVIINPIQAITDSAADTVELLKASTPGSLLVSLAASSFEDLAAITNPLLAEYMVLETGPDCSDCPFGTYVTARCTTSLDRVCSSCSSCLTGEWEVSECNIDHDTACKVCSDCPYGQFISSPCQAYSDTHCKTCTKCGPMQFESRSCGFGVDTLCDSCEHCSFDSPLVELQCQTEKYFWWKRQNCCWTKKGKQVSCDMLDWAEMQISTMEGKHENVFGTTSPPIPELQL